MPSIGHFVLDGFAAFGMLSAFWLICVGAQVLIFGRFEQRRAAGEDR